MSLKFKPSILTANRLLEGDVVYMGQEGQWVEKFRSALVYHEEEAAKEALAKAATEVNKVVGAYLIEVQLGEDGIEPTHFRERFRAIGPSNYRHGKQEDPDVSLR